MGVVAVCNYPFVGSVAGGGGGAGGTFGLVKPVGGENGDGGKSESGQGDKNGDEIVFENVFHVS